MKRKRNKKLAEDYCEEMVDLVHGYIALQARHSKTGGARRVTIHPPLRRILERAAARGGGRICPASWGRHWAALHRAAGWGSPARPWRQDVLRHTFASYHLGHFRSYTVLQYEVGHRDASLLRTRYVDLQGVEAAALFFEAAGAGATPTGSEGDAGALRQMRQSQANSLECRSGLC